MNKKIYKSILLFSMITGMMSTSAFAKEIPNVSPIAHSLISPDQYYPYDIIDHWAEEPLKDFVYSDNLKGYDDGDGGTIIQPDKSITRAEFATLLIRTLQINSVGSGKTFTDVKNTDWYYNAIQTASNSNIINGTSATTFEPNRAVTRAEIATMIERGFKNTVSFQGTAKNFPDVSGHWAEQNIQDVSKLGIIGGYPDGNFQPNKTATRAEAITMLERTLNNELVGIPSDQTLTDLAKNYFFIYNYVNTTDYEKVPPLADTYTTGYWGMETYGLIGLMPYYNDIGETSKIITEIQPTFTVSQKNTRTAKVKFANWKKTEEKVKKDGTKTSDTTITGGTLSMKKMNDGTWKIYNFKIDDTQIVN